MFKRCLLFLLLWLSSPLAFSVECLSVFPSSTTVAGTALSLPSFLVSDESGGSYDAWYYSTTVPLSLRAGQYKNVIGTDISFTEENGEYRIKNLQLGAEGSLTLAAGDYYIDNFMLADSTELIISGAGTVRIFAKDVQFGNYSQINQAGGKLLLVSYDSVVGGNYAHFYGLLYADNAIVLANYLNFSGAMAAQTSIYYGSYETINDYSADYVSSIVFGEVCTNTVPVSLLLHFPFDDGAGQTVTDASGNARHATLGSTTGADDNDPEWACNSLEFDGANNEYIQTQVFSPPEVGSVAFWLKVPEKPTAIVRIFGFGDGWEARWDGGYIHWDINKEGVNNTIVTSTANITPGSWVHFAALTDVNTGRWQVYVNGQQDDSGTASLQSQPPGVLHLGSSTRPVASGDQLDFTYANGSWEIRIDDVFVDRGTVAAGSHSIQVENGVSSSTGSGSSVSLSIAPADDWVVKIDGAVVSRQVQIERTATSVATQNFTGSLSDFRLYTGLLTEDVISALAATPPAGCITLPAYYSFEQDDSSSQVVDFSGNGNHGSALNSSFITNDGKYCKAFASNGENTDTESGSQSFNSGIDVNYIGKQGTISFWYKGNHDWGDKQRMLFDASLGDASVDANNKRFYLYVHTDGGLNFKFEDSADDFISLSEAPAMRTANTWYYVAVTWDLTANALKLYVDGQQVASSSISSSGQLGELGELYFGDDSPNFTGGLESSINGYLDEVRVYSQALSQADIQTAMNDNNCLNQVNHYQIIHGPNGITCEAEPITIKACANVYDGTCTESTATTSVKLVATGSDISTQVEASTGDFIGTGEVSLSYRQNETITLSLTEPAALPTASTVCINGNDNSCTMNFSSAIFRFFYDNGSGETTSIPPQVAGEYFDGALKIRAMRDANGVCKSTLSSFRGIKLSQENVNPGGTEGLNFYANNPPSSFTPQYPDGEPIAFDKYPAISSTVDLYFDQSNDGYAVIPFPVYYDAGEVRLHAKYSSRTLTIEGASSPFWVSPKKLTLDGSGANQVDTSSTYKAGQDFTLTVSAVNAQGNVTQNYLPGQIQLQATRTLPTTADFDGQLTYSASGAISTALATSATFSNATLNPFANGVSSYANSWYSEVGTVNLAVKDSNYGGQGIEVSGDNLNLGRFLPDHFEFISGAVTNGNVIADSTYMGQPTLGFEYQIEARNLKNSVTKNYTGSNATVSLVAENNSNGVNLNLGNRLSGYSGSWNAGVYSHNDDGTGTDLGSFSRATAVDGPYDSIRYGINVTDTDGTVLTGLNMLSSSARALSSLPSKMRYGRWLIENAYGPETADLPVPMQIQYWDGSAFVTDTSNSIDTFDASDLMVTNIDLPSGAPNKLATSGIFASGRTPQGSHLTLAKPGAGNRGKAKVSYSAPSWLKFDWDGDGNVDDDPSAIATFGLYRGNDRVIYWRELTP